MRGIKKKCTDPSPTTTDSTVTTEIPFLCPATDGSYPISGTCSSEYFTCLEGLPFLQVNHFHCGQTLQIDYRVNKVKP